MFGPPASLNLALRILLTASLAVTSWGASAVRVSEPTNILWLPAGAEIRLDRVGAISIQRGRSLYVDGTAHVAFNVTGERHALSDSLIRHFTTSGWRQRTTQYLNPRFATSFNDGWQHQCACIVETDPEGKPIRREPQYEWRGEWEDPLGNIVTCSLGAEGRRVRGYAAYIPQPLADAARRLHASGS
jgi:hypothetical protein